MPKQAIQLARLHLVPASGACIWRLHLTPASDAWI
jgi:hypothetical protein